METFKKSQSPSYPKGNTLDKKETKIEGDNKEKEIVADELRGIGKSPSLDDKAQQGKILSPPMVAPSTPASQSPNLYEFFLDLVGVGGIIEIFGDTGSLKSNCCVQTCKDAKKINKTFFYLDTEGKVGLMNKKELGAAYQYLPVWDKIMETIEKGLPKADLMIVDSIGFPVSTKYASMKVNEQGDTLQDMMAMVGKYLKEWAFNNNAIVIFTNQPKSSFMKSQEELLRPDPFGDKVHFAASIILKTTKTIIPGHADKPNNRIIPPSSIGTFTSHRSPDLMDDIEVFTMQKSDNEVKITIPNHIIKRLQELKG